MGDMIFQGIPPLILLMNGYAAIRQKKSWCFGEWLPSLKLTAPANSWLEDNFPSNGPVLCW